MNDITTQITTQIFHSIGQIFVSFWILIPILIIAIFLKSSYFKGKLGEAVVSRSITKKLDSSIYHIINNVTLSSFDGTTQIDHIIVSIYGIFVIETKNMKGWIFGDKNNKTWTQTIYKRSHKFQNPIHQNYKHIKTLVKITGIEEDKFHSVIVFTGDSTFKTKMPDNVLDRGWVAYVLSKNDLLLSYNLVQDATECINSQKLEASLKTNQEHINQLKAKQRIISTSHNCPKCGSTLIKRVAKTGINIGREFYGCSQFPQCRYTRAIN